MNEELAEKYGIDFNTQYTWDQFIEWGKQVHEADPDTYLLCTNKEYVTNLGVLYLHEAADRQDHL